LFPAVSTPSRRLHRTAAAALRGALLAGALLALAPGARAQIMGPNGLPILAPNVKALNEINLALREGDKDKALKLADDAREQFPRDAQLRFVHAVVLGDLDRTAEATAEFESMNSDFPELPEPYNNLAVIHANKGDYAMAQRLLQQALTARPAYATARENLGDLYVAMAVEAYEQAGKLDPASPVLKRKLALARDLNLQMRKARDQPIASPAPAVPAAGDGKAAGNAAGAPATPAATPSMTPAATTPAATAPASAPRSATP
jgi:tetratricopeptide (TPR) repeat protein